MTKRHPDPHIAMGQVLQSARDALGPVQPHDTPSRDNRFDLVPEDDEDDASVFWRVMRACTYGAALSTIVIAVFELVVLK